jgi:diaminopimelate decarboxylase
VTGIREACQGVSPLQGRLEPWMRELCDGPEHLSELVEQHGSPLNVLDPAPLGRNASELTRAADEAGVDMKVFFARKANKALAFVDRARELGLGVDVASERELAQTLERGVSPRDIVVTAAIKPPALLRLSVDAGVTIVVDNEDELERLVSLARPATVALRLAPTPAEGRPCTRFGLGLQDALAMVDRHVDRAGPIAITGVHFHLDGYSARERVVAIGESLQLVDALRERGHAIAFLDIGGGIPMSYLESGDEWSRFWAEHRRGLLGERPPLTFEGHGLGLLAHRGEVVGRANVYPYFQAPTRGAWLAEVLQGPVAPALRDRGLELRCEPGRSLVDGCGVTVARVEFRKTRGDGTWLIGLAMNRTQCRSTSDDFLVDPLLVRRPGAASADAIEGYLVGAYCIERELLTWRRLRFPHGVAVGDLVVFPNTAGYLMHILESSSHQIPLALNVVVGSGRGDYLDPIDER